MAKKNRRDSFVLLMQKGKLNPENLLEIENIFPNLNYEVELDDYDEDEDGKEEDEDIKEEKEEKEDDIGTRIHKNIKDMFGNNN